MIRKQCFEKIGYFNENIICCHDYEMWLRLLKAGYRFGRVPKTLFAYRQHPENFSHNRELLRFDFDKICSSATEDFTVQELFGDLIKNKGWERIVKREYDKLADTCYFGHLPLSARAAAKKSLEIGRPFFFLFFLTNTLQTLLILCSVLKTTVKLVLVTVNPKFARCNSGKYRERFNNLFFKLKYRLFKVFFYRYGLNTSD